MDTLWRRADKSLIEAETYVILQLKNMNYLPLSALAKTLFLTP